MPGGRPRSSQPFRRLLAGAALLGSQLTAGPSTELPAWDLPGWQLVLAEDFDSPAGPGRFATTYPGWAGYDGAQDTSRHLGRPAATQGQYDSAGTTTVHDGLVDIRLHTANGTPRVMALTPTPDGQWWDGSTYGRYSVRFRTETVPGYKVAWLLWPTSDEWTEGEIDFPEGALGDEIAGASHSTAGDPSVNAWTVDTGATMAEWHVATIEWLPDRLTFTLDDRSWTTTEPTAIPHRPMRWVLQTETELTAGPPDPEVSGHVYVDWVAAWRPG
ncbi:glycosyl hydrolase family 16 [Modestobacter roseus]|uniref:Glycosyl hydrolase family 16 n=1 Tax=Modestobacter roseus TaxID=1181884 RepID=A0A562IWW9_9ACTN|nr:glycoside hydrolase family 16 protein [Modestobacter roseus]TWH75340.1 glycosyl hydrolase family 16 [Modestobacter roseus]